MPTDQNPPAADPEVTITMKRSAWVLVNQSNPVMKETYTHAGIELFNAWQPILQAANGENPDD